jgi:methyl-accepting chemotaxis protein
MINFDELAEMANDFEKRAEAYNHKHTATMKKFDQQIEQISNNIKKNGEDIKENLNQMRNLDGEFAKMSQELDALEKW